MAALVPAVQVGARMSDLASRIDALVGEAAADVEADRRLVESVASFDPALHPRGRAGKWIPGLHDRVFHTPKGENRSGPFKVVGEWRGGYRLEHEATGTTHVAALSELSPAQGHLSVTVHERPIGRKEFQQGDKVKLPDGRLGTVADKVHGGVSKWTRPSDAYVEPTYSVHTTASRFDRALLDKHAQALADWREGRVHLGNDGNFRMKDGGKIAPWNSEVKKDFPTRSPGSDRNDIGTDLFHDAAQQAGGKDPGFKSERVKHSDLSYTGDEMLTRRAAIDKDLARAADGKSPRQTAIPVASGPVTIGSGIPDEWKVANGYGEWVNPAAGTSGLYGNTRGTLMNEGDRIRMMPNAEKHAGKVGVVTEIGFGSKSGTNRAHFDGESQPVEFSYRDAMPESRQPWARLKPGVDVEKMTFHYLAGRPAPANPPEGSAAWNQFTYGMKVKGGQKLGKSKAETAALLRKLTQALAVRDIPDAYAVLLAEACEMRAAMGDEPFDVEFVLAESEADEIRDLVKSLHRPCDCGADNLPHEWGSACPKDGPVAVEEAAYDEVLHPRGRGGKWTAKLGKIATLHRQLGGNSEIQKRLDAGDLHAGDVTRMSTLTATAKRDAPKGSKHHEYVHATATELEGHLRDAEAHMRDSRTTKIHAPQSGTEASNRGTNLAKAGDITDEEHRARVQRSLTPDQKGAVSRLMAKGATEQQAETLALHNRMTFEKHDDGTVRFKKQGRHYRVDANGRARFSMTEAFDPDEASAELLFVEEAVSHGIFFDPHLHPRDRRGEFMDVLTRLDRHVELSLPHGVTVQRGKVGGYRISGPGGRTRFAHAPEQAASHAFAFHDGMRTEGAGAATAAWSPHAAQAAAASLRKVGAHIEAAHTAQHHEIRTDHLTDDQLRSVRDDLAAGGHHVTAAELHGEIEARQGRDRTADLLARRSSARAAVTGDLSPALARAQQIAQDRHRRLHNQGVARDELAVLTPGGGGTRSKAQALVDAGLASDLADARAQLADMGERGMASPGGEDHVPLSGPEGKRYRIYAFRGDFKTHVLGKNRKDALKNFAEREGHPFKFENEGHTAPDGTRYGAMSAFKETPMEKMEREARERLGGMPSPGGERSAGGSTIAARNRNGGLTVIAHTRHVDISGERVGRSGATVWKGSRIEGLRKVVADHQAHEIDGHVVDAQTANLLVQVHDALSPESRGKFESMPLARLVDFAWSRVGGGKGRVAEAVDLLLL